MPDEINPTNTINDPPPNNEAPLQTESPIPPKKKNSPLVPILISIIIILLVAGGFIAYKYFTSSKILPVTTKSMEESKTPPPSPTLTPTPTPQSTLDPTSDWISFTDDTMGITFKYPPIWDYHYLNQNPPSIMVAPKDIVDKIKNAPGGFGGGTFLTMIISLHDYDPTPQTDEFSSVVSQSATIDSKEFTHYTSTFLQEGPGFASGEVIEDYIAPFGNQFLKIGLLDLDQKEILDQIISSITLNQ
jgi:hypothetical protein